MKARDDSLARDGILGLDDFDLAPATDSIDFCKGGDKSMLASMNQPVVQVTCELLDVGHWFPLVNQRLNRIPKAELNYRYAIDELPALADRS